MTKKEMIETIQKTEKEAWIELQHAKNQYGMQNTWTVSLRKKWSTLNNVLEACKIESIKYEREEA
jgi:hypothetical protein